MKRQRRLPDQEAEGVSLETSPLLRSTKQHTVMSSAPPPTPPTSRSVDGAPRSERRADTTRQTRKRTSRTSEQAVRQSLPGDRSRSSHTDGSRTDDNRKRQKHIANATHSPSKTARAAKLLQMMGVNELNRMIDDENTGHDMSDSRLRWTPGSKSFVMADRRGGDSSFDNLMDEEAHTRDRIVLLPTQRARDLSRFRDTSTSSASVSSAARVQREPSPDLCAEARSPASPAPQASSSPPKRQRSPRKTNIMPPASPSGVPPLLSSPLATQIEGGSPLLEEEWHDYTEALLISPQHPHRAASRREQLQVEDVTASPSQRKTSGQAGPPASPVHAGYTSHQEPTIRPEESAVPALAVDEDIPAGAEPSPAQRCVDSPSPIAPIAATVERSDETHLGSILAPHPVTSTPLLRRAEMASSPGFSRRVDLVSIDMSDNKSVPTRAHSVPEDGSVEEAHENVRERTPSATPLPTVRTHIPTAEESPTTPRGKQEVEKQDEEHHREARSSASLPLKVASCVAGTPAFSTPRRSGAGKTDLSLQHIVPTPSPRRRLESEATRTRLSNRHSAQSASSMLLTSPFHATSPSSSSTAGTRATPLRHLLESHKRQHRSPARRALSSQRDGSLAPPSPTHFLRKVNNRISTPHPYRVQTLDDLEEDAQTTPAAVVVPLLSTLQSSQKAMESSEANDDPASPSRQSQGRSRRLLWDAHRSGPLERDFSTIMAEEDSASEEEDEDQQADLTFEVEAGRDGADRSPTPANIFGHLAPDLDTSPSRASPSSIPDVTSRQLQADIEIDSERQSSVEDEVVHKDDRTESPDRDYSYTFSVEQEHDQVDEHVDGFDEEVEDEEEQETFGQGGQHAGHDHGLHIDEWLGRRRDRLTIEHVEGVESEERSTERNVARDYELEFPRRSHSLSPSAGQMGQEADSQSDGDQGVESNDGMQCDIDDWRESNQGDGRGVSQEDERDVVLEGESEDEDQVGLEDEDEQDDELEDEDEQDDELENKYSDDHATHDGLERNEDIEPTNEDEVKDEEDAEPTTEDEDEDGDEDGSDGYDARHVIHERRLDISYEDEVEPVEESENEIEAERVYSEWSDAISEDDLEGQSSVDKRHDEVDDGAHEEQHESSAYGRPDQSASHRSVVGPNAADGLPQRIARRRSDMEHQGAMVISDGEDASDEVDDDDELEDGNESEAGGHFDDDCDIYRADIDVVYADDEDDRRHEVSNDDEEEMAEPFARASPSQERAAQSDRANAAVRPAVHHSVQDSPSPRRRNDFSVSSRHNKSGSSAVHDATLSSVMLHRAGMLASRPSMVEVSSMNREAAARAAEILKKHHRYVQYGTLEANLEDQSWSHTVMDEMDLDATHNLTGRDRSGMETGHSSVGTRDQTPLRRKSRPSAVTPLVPGAFPGSVAKVKAPSMNKIYSEEATMVKRIRTGHGRDYEPNVFEFAQAEWSCLEGLVIAEITAIANAQRSVSTVSKSQALLRSTSKLDGSALVDLFLGAHDVGAQADDALADWSRRRMLRRIRVLVKRFVRQLQERYPHLQVDLDRSESMADSVLDGPSTPHRRRLPVDESGVAASVERLPFKMMVESTPAARPISEGLLSNAVAAQSDLRADAAEPQDEEMGKDRHSPEAAISPAAAPDGVETSQQRLPSVSSSDPLSDVTRIARQSLGMIGSLFGLVRGRASATESPEPADQQVEASIDVAIHSEPEMREARLRSRPVSASVTIPGGHLVEIAAQRADSQQKWSRREVENDSKSQSVSAAFRPSIGWMHVPGTGVQGRDSVEQSYATGRVWRQPTAPANVSNSDSISTSRLTISRTPARRINSGASSYVQPTALSMLSPHTHAEARHKVSAFRDSRADRDWRSPRHSRHLRAGQVSVASTSVTSQSVMESSRRSYVTSGAGDSGTNRIYGKGVVRSNSINHPSTTAADKALSNPPSRFRNF